MRHPVTRELFAYWDTLCAGRTAPERSAIDPAAIRHLLAYTFLLEVGEAAGCAREIRFRLSGTRLNALFQRDLKNEPFAEIWDRADRAGAEDLVGGVLDDRAPIVGAVSAAPADHDPCTFELLLLPLRHHGRTHVRLLGSLAPPTTPTWIGLRPVETLRLSSFRTVLPRDRARLGIFGGAAIGSETPANAPPLGVAPPDPLPSRAAGGRPMPFRVVPGGRRDIGATVPERIAEPG